MGSSSARSRRTTSPTPSRPRATPSTSAASSWRTRSRPSARTTWKSACTRTSRRTSRSRSCRSASSRSKSRPSRPSPRTRKLGVMPDFVDTPPAGADAWREVWRDDRRYRPRPARFEWLFRFVRRMVSRANEAEAERQKNFNVVLIDLLADLRRDVAALRDDLKADLATVQSDVRRADEALAADVANVRELIPVAARRNDALIAALDQKIESVAARLRDVTNPFLERAPEAVREDFLYRRLEEIG